MFNSIKKILLSLQKFYFVETLLFIFLTLFSYAYRSISLSISLIIGLLGLFPYLNILMAKKHFLDPYVTFFYHKPILSNMCILSQSSKKSKYECQEIIGCLMSKKKVEEIISKLPKGKYKSITHSSVINAINTFDNAIYISNPLYNDKLSNIRKRLLGKECPCSDSVDCKYRKYILSAQEHKNTTDFYYIEFTIK